PPAASTGGSTTSGSTTTTAPAATGNPAAGKTVFAANGCAACHTFGPAGATGKVGPDLDDLQAEATKANRGSLDAFVHESIVDPGGYIAPGYPDAMPPTFGKSLSATQLEGLIGGLTQGK